MIAALGALLGLLGGVATAAPPLAAGGPIAALLQRALHAGGVILRVQGPAGRPVNKAFIKITKMSDQRQ